MVRHRFLHARARGSEVARKHEELPPVKLRRDRAREERERGASDREHINHPNVFRIDSKTLGVRRQERQLELVTPEL